MDYIKPIKRPPVPHITIALDPDCSLPFRPGSRVKGHISLQSKTQRQLFRAETIFFGRAVTHSTRIQRSGTAVRIYGNHTSHFHDDACLFRYTQDISGSLMIEPDRPYIWRFDYTFDDSAKLVGGSAYKGPTAGAGIYADGRHTLPPTFERYFNDHHHAFVEYRLQAVFQFADWDDPATMHLPLIFTPNGQWPDPSKLAEYVRPLEKLSSHKLLPDQTSKRLSFMDKSSAPSVDVIVRASLNIQAIAPSTTPLYVCVELHNRSTPSIQIPQIRVEVKSVTLYQITFFRTRGVYGRSGEYQEIGEDGILLPTTPKSIDATPRSRNGEKDAGFIFYPATFDMTFPDTVRPSFHTFNINNNYQMQVVVAVHVAGKKLGHKFIVESFTVLPPG